MTDLRLDAEAASAAKEKGLSAGGTYNGQVASLLLLTGGIGGSSKVSQRIESIVDSIKTDLQGVGKNIAVHGEDDHHSADVAIETVTGTDEDGAQRIGK